MRLSVRILLWLVVGSALTSVVVYPLIHWLAERPIATARVATVSGVGPLLSRLLVSEPTLLDHPEEISAMLGFPVEVVERSKLPPKVALNLEQSGIASQGKISGTIQAFVNIDNDPRVVVLGPLPEPNFRAGLQATVIIVVPLLVAVLITFLVVRPILVRLASLQIVTDRLSRGDLDARADETGGDALGAVARSFNAMGERVQLMLTSQCELLQAVSHEFRTPASRIRFELELLRSKKNNKDRETKIAAIEDGLDDLDELISELTEYVRYSSGARKLDLSEVAIANEVEQAIERHRHLGAECGTEIILESTVDESLTVLASLRHFRRTLDNLISNAVRYAGSRVVVRGEQIDEFVIVRIDDDGPGIDPADRARVFEPFTRLEHSRCRKYGGTGLGLALVRRILDWHGGDVDVEDAALGGASFVCRWPVQGDAMVDVDIDRRVKINCV